MSLAFAAPGLSDTQYAAALAELEGVGPVSEVDASSELRSDQDVIASAHLVVVDEKAGAAMLEPTWAGHSRTILGPIVVIYPGPAGNAGTVHRQDLERALDARARVELHVPGALNLAAARLTA